MVAATVAAAGVSLAIKKITSDAMASAVAFTQFETETGASAQTLQKWQSVAEQTNQSAESVTNAIKSIADNQAKIRLGQGNISGYQLLGIDPRQDPFKILEDLREKTKGLSEAQKKNVLSMMGISSSMLQTLNLTREQFDSMAGNAFIISPSAIKTLNDTKSAVDMAGKAIKWLKAQIATALSPQIKEMTKNLTAFIKANEQGIIKGFQKAFTIVSKFAQAVGSVASMINKAVAGTIGWERGLKLLAAGFLAFNLILMASPLMLIVAGIILLVAVLDDIAVYSKGGNSLFGKLMEKFPGMEKVILGFVDKLAQVKELFQALASGDEMAIDGVLEQWGQFGQTLIGIRETIEAIQALFDKQNWKDAATAIAQDTPASQAAIMGGSYAASATVPGSGLAAQLIAKLIGAFGDKGGGDTNNNITVYGTSTPDETAGAVKRELQRAYNSTSGQRGRSE